MSHCSNCGEEIKDLSQKFCEKCGTSIKSDQEKSEKALTPTASIPSSTTLGFQKYNRPGGLFDLSRNYYILKEKYWDI
ncbi:MAG: hypothetical protein Lokiarch_20130 [Candidatus Lokiarchaeum sp. GC14_75]|nr:MAG: hypothetical protein Lokiarch_20130 [Candidatus Lokiarchaeum sp. GC14_75]